MTRVDNLGTFGWDHKYKERSSVEVVANCGVPFSTQSHFSKIKCDSDYVKSEARYSINMGETCANGLPGRYKCKNYLDELRDYHYTAMHINYYQDALALMSPAYQSKVAVPRPPPQP